MTTGSAVTNFAADRAAALKVSEAAPEAQLMAVDRRFLRRAVRYPEQDANERRDQLLLMAHDGGISGDIAFLPYLYWVDTLAHPDRLRARLHPGRVGPRRAVN